MLFFVGPFLLRSPPKTLHHLSLSALPTPCAEHSHLYSVTSLKQNPTFKQGMENNRPTTVQKNQTMNYRMILMQRRRGKRHG